ncbi:hypothetical protein G6F56_012575 [Rhizopus delemar]|nr:hypothetical protein G6F56_012575 [Rhizopus delemar]
MNLSSSSSSTGKQKKSRTSHACTNCRRKKIKCDGRQPSCSSCLQLGSTCGYEEGKKRGPRKGYVQTLEERLVQMEQKLMNTPGTLYPDTMDDIPPMPIIEHLVDIFFKHINAFIPIIHHATLKQSIEDGTVSRPLLYGVLATSARFSDHPSIRTNPPYLACERFASKALSLVDANILQPTLANIQFWGIMSCLEYGRASGAI